MVALWLAWGCGLKAQGTLRVDAVSEDGRPELQAVSADVVASCKAPALEAWESLGNALRRALIAGEPATVSLGACVVAISPKKREVRLTVTKNADTIQVPLTRAHAVALANASAEIMKKGLQPAPPVPAGVQGALLTGLHAIYEKRGQGASWRQYHADVSFLLTFAQDRQVQSREAAQALVAQIRDTLTRDDCEVCFEPGKLRRVWPPKRED